MAIRYANGTAGMGSWTDVVKQYAVAAGKSAAGAVAKKALAPKPKAAGATTAPPVSLARKPAASGPPWGKIALGAAVVGGLFFFMRRRRA